MHKYFIWNEGAAYDLLIMSLKKRLWQILSKLDNPARKAPDFYFPPFILQSIVQSAEHN